MKELDIKSTTDKKGNNNSIVKVNNGESVQLFLYEEQKLINTQTYCWQCEILDVDGVPSHTYIGEPQILLHVPGFYVGYPVKVDLKAIFKNTYIDNITKNITWNKDKQKSDPKYIYKLPEATSRTFTTQCPLKVSKVEWLSFNYLPLKHEENKIDNLCYFTKGYLHIEVEGLNAKQLSYQVIYGANMASEEYISIEDPNRTKYETIESPINVANVHLNEVYIPFEIPKSLYLSKESQYSAEANCYGTYIDINIKFTDSPSLEKIPNILREYVNTLLKTRIFLIDRTFIEDWVLDKISLAAIQPVLVGAPVIVANNHLPCKFTEVVFSEEEEGKNVFSETGSNFENFVRDTFHLTWRTLEEHPYTQQKKYDEFSFTKIESFAMISGMESKKVNVSIKNFETDKCKLKTKHDSKIIYLDGEKRKLQTEKKDGVVQVEDQLNINYDYGVLEKVFSPWNYFFPFNKPQKHSLKIDSCRHSITLPINVYPDVQWVFSLKFEIFKGIEADSFKKLFSKESRSGKKLKEQAKDSIKDSFEVALGISWNNKKRYSAITINPFDAINTIKEDPTGLPNILKDFVNNQLYIKFKLLFDKVQEVMGFLDMFKNAVDTVRYLEDKNGTNVTVPNQRKEKVKFELTFPSVSTSLSWRAGVHEGRSGFVIEGNLEGTLIGCSLTFDMFALAGKMPQLRLAVLALDIIQWTTSLKFTFDLVIEGEIGFEGKLAYDEAQDKFDAEGGVKAGLSAKVLLMAKVTQTKNNRLVTKTYGAEISGGFEIVYNLTVDNGLWGQSEINFTGLKGSVYIKVTVTKKGNVQGDDSDGVESEDKDTLYSDTFIESVTFWEGDKKQLI